MLFHEGKEIEMKGIKRIRLIVNWLCVYSVGEAVSCCVRLHHAFPPPPLPQRLCVGWRCPVGGMPPPPPTTVRGRASRSHS